MVRFEACGSNSWRKDKAEASKNYARKQEAEAIHFARKLVAEVFVEQERAMDLEELDEQLNIIQLVVELHGWQNLIKMKG